MTGNYEEDLRALSRKWEELTDIPEAPRSVMNVIEYSLGSQRRAEVYTNRLLKYFLDPEESHGMDEELLKAFLDGIPEECEFDEDTYDLSNVQVQDQVYVSNLEDESGEIESKGEADLLIESPNEWFLLVELKFSAGENNLRGEGPSQTEIYHEPSKIDGNLRAEYESGGYYLYLHQHDKERANEEEFANWTWKGLREDVLEEFYVENSPRYPQRTAAQLREFLDDLQEITGMTEREQNQLEKVELYLENYEAIKDVTDTFDDRWDEFTDEWGRRLGEALENNGSGSYFEVQQDVVGFDTGESNPEWRFRTSSSDWGMIFKDGWWRHTDDLRRLNGRPDDRNDVRIGFHHRLGRNRENAIRDNELIFYFRNMGANDQKFKDRFKQAFYTREEEFVTTFPDAAETTGNKRNMTEATYDIRVDSNGDFFEAYTGALRRAVEDHIVENENLVNLIDEVYEDCIDEIYR